MQLNLSHPQWIILDAVCVPLQIDILNMQAQTLTKARPDIKVEYQPDKELKIFYWRNATAQQTRQGAEAAFHTCVQLIVLDDGKKLSIQHNPVLLEPETQQPVSLTVVRFFLSVFFPFVFFLWHLYFFLPS